MKIAFSVNSKNSKDKLDPRFGRAEGFLIYDDQFECFSYLENTQQLNAPQGAGIQAAQNVINQGVDSLVSGHCGPKAFKLLTHSGIKIYTAKGISPEEALIKLKEGQLKELKDADVEGHWV